MKRLLFPLLAALVLPGTAIGQSLQEKLNQQKGAANANSRLCALVRNAHQYKDPNNRFYIYLHSDGKIHMYNPNYHGGLEIMKKSFGGNNPDCQLNVGKLGRKVWKSKCFYTNDGELIRKVTTTEWVKDSDKLTKYKQDVEQYCPSGKTFFEYRVYQTNYLKK